MTDTIAPHTAAARRSRPPVRLHPLALRIMHWLNAVAVLVLILSGWAIYNDEVIFGWLHFPGWMTLGDGPEGALQWHFLAMWILGLNGIAYLAYGFATGRFRRMLLPIRFGEVVGEIRAALALRLSHQELTRYNAVQRVLYIGVILVGIVQVLSGLVVWKPVQFSELAVLFGSFQSARLVHFLGMAAIVAFVLVHVTLALLVPRTLVAMVTGGPHLVPDPPGDMPAGPEPMEAASPMQSGCSMDDTMSEPTTDPQAAQSRPRQPAS
jgi:thiosulfate reductase cytochrome b subunit